MFALCHAGCGSVFTCAEYVLFAHQDPCFLGEYTISLPTNHDVLLLPLLAALSTSAARSATADVAGRRRAFARRGM